MVAVVVIEHLDCMTVAADLSTAIVEAEYFEPWAAYCSNYLLGLGLYHYSAYSEVKCSVVHIDLVVAAVVVEGVVGLKAGYTLCCPGF